MFSGSSNAVNLTDGMDGLAAGVTLIALVPFALLAWMRQEFNLVLLILCLIGAFVGDLHFNKILARVFMGDSG